MWILTIRSPNGEPKTYMLHPGHNTIGRMSGNDVVVLDPSASRYHAEVIYEPDANSITIQDLGSTNGTFLNRERLTGLRPLRPNDVIRIGQHLIELSSWDEQARTISANRPHNTRQLTRDLILESLDQHAVLLAEVATQLNTVMDLPTALSTVSSMMKATMGADRCELLLYSQFDQLQELGLARSIAQQAIQQRSAVIVQDAQTDPSVGRSAVLLNIHAAMCVPVMAGDEILGLIYVFKNRPRSRPFDQRDLQLAIAISHQAALTIQRMQLLERVRREEVVSKLLQRFLSPQEAEFLMKEYNETGQLPAIEEHTLTVLVADIVQSTRMAERLGSRRFSRILSTYYQQMTEVVFNHHGLLNKYIGDGLMAVFGMPNQPPEPEMRAVQAAIEMLHKLEYINQALSEKIAIGIGINTGPAMAGYLGTQDYIEFSVIGYPVNIAWWLESLARPNRILVGYPTYQAITGRFKIREAGALTVKQQTDPIQAYEILVDEQ